MGNCSKNKTNKSCKPNQKSHIIHAAAEMQSLLFSCLFTKQKQNKSKSLFTNQLLSILSSIHRLHKSFIVGIQRNQNFRPIVAPKTPQKKSVKQKKHDFFKEISLVQYMNKKKENQIFS